MTSAMLDLVEHWGILALPLHDALLVRESEAEIAREALERAYNVVGKVRAEVRVKAAGV